MKTINLKKYYYPLYETDTFIELPDEIADAIVEEWRADHNSEQRLWSHWRQRCGGDLWHQPMENAPGSMA